MGAKGDVSIAAAIAGYREAALRERKAQTPVREYT